MMKDTAYIEAYPDPEELPVMKDNSSLFFRKADDWIEERQSFFDEEHVSKHVPLRYIVQFMDAKRIYTKAKSKLELLPFPETQSEWEVIEHGLNKMHKYYRQLLNFLRDSGFLKRPKQYVARVSYSIRSRRLKYYDPKKKVWQEVIPNQNMIWATASHKIYENCRQKRGSIAPETLYEMVRKEHPVSEWESWLSDPVGSMKRLQYTIQSANRWAKKHFSQELFSCSKRGVKKLI